MVNPVKLQLGDIIEIIAPTDMEINTKTYYIGYIDSEKIRLEEADGNEQVLTLSDGHLDNESIESILIKSRAEEEGYARQNNLIMGVWIDIFFGGDLPLTITGKITNLDGDKIEITTYPEKEVIFLDFAYKGLPEDLPIEKIQIRRAPEISLQVGEETAIGMTEAEDTELAELEKKDPKKAEVVKQKVEKMKKDTEEFLTKGFEMKNGTPFTQKNIENMKTNYGAFMEAEKKLIDFQNDPEHKNFSAPDLRGERTNQYKKLVEELNAAEAKAFIPQMKDVDPNSNEAKRLEYIITDGKQFNKYSDQHPYDKQFRDLHGLPKNKEAPTTIPNTLSKSTAEIKLSTPQIIKTNTENKIAKLKEQLVKGKQEEEELKLQPISATEINLSTKKLTTNQIKEAEEKEKARIARIESLSNEELRKISLTENSKKITEVVERARQSTQNRKAKVNAEIKAEEAEDERRAAKATSTIHTQPGLFSVNKKIGNAYQAVLNKKIKREKELEEQAKIASSNSLVKPKVKVIEKNTRTNKERKKADLLAHLGITAEQIAAKKLIK